MILHRLCAVGKLSILIPFYGNPQFLCVCKQISVRAVAVQLMQSCFLHEKHSRERQNELFSIASINRSRFDYYSV